MKVITREMLTGNKNNNIFFNALTFASALSVYVAIFAARFSLSQIFPDIFSEGSVLDEVRTWAILGGVMLAAVSWRFCKPIEGPANKIQVWRSVGLVAIVQIAVIIHTLLYKSDQAPAYFIWELFAIVLVVIVLGVYYHIWRVQFIDALMWVALVFAVLLIVWIWGALIYSKIVINENPIGTTFSFYRIQILGGFAALMIYFRLSKKRGLKVALVFCSVLCFSGAFLTLSKAALLAGTAGLLLLAAIYVTWFDKVKALIVLMVFASAIGLFIMVSGSGFASRVSEGMLGTGYALNVQSISPPSKEEVLVSSVGAFRYEPCLGMRLDDCKNQLALAEFAAQRRLAEVLACTAGGYACGFRVERWEQEIVDTMLQFRVYIPDFSFRIRLLIHGLSGITNAPWMGNGFGHFHAVAVNLYTKNTDHYFYPHNILIEILYAVGILGALFVGAVLLVLVWEVLRSKDKIQPCSPIFAFVVSIGVGSLFGGDYLDFRLVWLGLLLCIMLCENTVSFKFKLPEAVK
jgi:hypothetical protein